MKKIMAMLAIIFIASTGYAASRLGGGIFSGTEAQEATTGFTVGDGDIAAYDEFMSYTGFMNYRDVFDDLPAASVTGYFDTDIATTTLVSAATTFTGALITQPALPMNIIAEVTFDDGESTTTVTGSLLITGVDARGESATETLTISTVQATGNIAWSSITSLKWTVTAITGRETTTSASLQCGPGTKVGLSNDIQAAADVYQVSYDDSGTTADDVSYTLNTTYDTIIFGTTNDGTTDVGTVVYKVKKR